MHLGQCPRALGYATLALVMVMGLAVPGQAQDHDGHGAPSAAAPQKLTPQQNDLVTIVKMRPSASPT